MKHLIKAAALVSIVASFSVLSTPQKILFGSCGHQDKDIPIFDAINKEQADLFIFLGDNIYGDTNDMRVLADKYQRLGAKPGFKTLKAQTPLIAMWDDHDFLGESQLLGCCYLRLLWFLKLTCYFSPSINQETTRTGRKKKRVL